MYLAPIRRLIIAIIIINVGVFLYFITNRFSFMQDKYYAPDIDHMFNPVREVKYFIMDISGINNIKIHKTETVSTNVEQYTIINDEVVEEIKLFIEDTLNKF